MDNSSDIAQTPQTAITPGFAPITNLEWNQKYWFDSLQLITVRNPKPDPWNFMVEQRHYTIGGNAHEEFPGVIANVYLDQMSKILAQDDDRLGFMADPNLKKIYYDQLIIDVRSLVPQSAMGQAAPAYLQQPVQAGQPERAPWDASLGERATDLISPDAAASAVQPSFPEAAPKPAPTAPVEPETRTFDYDGNTYKLVVGKDGRKMHYKGSQLTSAAEFNKAASML